MMKNKIIVFYTIVNLFSIGLVYGQKINKTQSRMIELFSKPILSDSTKHQFLIQVKNPGDILSNKRAVVLKRVSYNYFIVSDLGAIKSENLIKVSRANGYWKASDNLINYLTNHKSGQITVEAKLSDENLNFIGDTYGKTIKARDGYRIIYTSVALLEKLLEEPGIEFLELSRMPKEEININDADLSLNSISPIKDIFPDLNGKGIVVAVKEDKYDTGDLDLLYKDLNSTLASTSVTNHATVMATIIAGKGNTFINGLGAAPNANLASSNFQNLFPDPFIELKKLNCFLENHSYGTDIENYYGNEAIEYDKEVFINDSIIHVFSSGNIGTTPPSIGIYAGLINSSNLTGNFKQAKNVIVVGGIGRDNVIQALSSKGPAFDGRIKPELVAMGQDGTSGAAATTTGSIALIQQRYKKMFSVMPSSALVKAVLLTGADKLDGREISYSQGFGKLNALRALKIINERQFFTGTLSYGQEQRFFLKIPVECSKLTATLSWDDVPATVNTAIALVNDLDVTVLSPDGTIYRPWVLSSYPDIDSLAAQPVRRRDSINNNEQITIDNPKEGSYTIIVRGKKVNILPQKYFVAYDTENTNSFEFIYPSMDSDVLSNQGNYIRWKSTLKDDFGTFSVSYDNGNSWNLIGRASLPLTFAVWTPGTGFTYALFKMSANNRDFYSKQFKISAPLILHVGYNCGDGKLFYWNRELKASAYNIYNLDGNRLNLIATTKDTTIKVNQSVITSNYFAISALKSDGLEGIKSLTIDASLQGVGCYVRSLVAADEDSLVKLTLTLGAVDNLKKIIWQKQVNSTSFIGIGESLINSGLTYSFNDLNYKSGKEYYRAILVKNDVTTIISDTAYVIIIKDQQYFLYPNPVLDILNIINGSKKSCQLEIFNMNGARVRTESLTGFEFSLNLSSLVSGVYIAVIKINDKVVYNTKIIKR